MFSIRKFSVLPRTNSRIFASFESISSYLNTFCNDNSFDIFQTITTIYNGMFQYKIIKHLHTLWYLTSTFTDMIHFTRISPSYIREVRSTLQHIVFTLYVIYICFVSIFSKKFMVYRFQPTVSSSTVFSSFC